jgi:hypothetical protein
MSWTVVNILLICSLSLLIYSWYKRKNATICLLKFLLVVGFIVTPCLSEEESFTLGLPGIPVGPNSDGPVILGTHGEYTGNPAEEQSMWLASIEAFLNGTLSPMSFPGNNSTYTIA